MSGVVYFVQSERGGPIKIGFTNGDPVARLRGLQTGSPERLRIVASCEAEPSYERELHDRLRHHRMSGEWFRDCPSVRAVVVAAASAPIKKTRVKMLRCGCIPGWHFCPEADSAWRAVGLARYQNNTALFSEALQRFGEHVPARYETAPVDEVAEKRRERDAA